MLQLAKFWHFKSFCTSTEKLNLNVRRKATQPNVAASSTPLWLGQGTTTFFWLWIQSLREKKHPIRLESKQKLFFQRHESSPSPIWLTWSSTEVRPWQVHHPSGQLFQWFYPLRPSPDEGRAGYTLPPPPLLPSHWQPQIKKEVYGCRRTGSAFHFNTRLAWRERERERGEETGCILSFFFLPSSAASDVERRPGRKVAWASDCSMQSDDTYNFVFKGESALIVWMALIELKFPFHGCVELPFQCVRKDGEFLPFWTLRAVIGILKRGWMHTIETIAICLQRSGVFFTVR